ncbi:MAG TPA: hypothetical protein VHJ54_09750 [Solirubrobacterales bacterium]|jgi:hypothetical protein|nr:hypothetical protein [Solirubrobacterales bacterium]
MGHEERSVASTQVAQAHLADRVDSSDPRTGTREREHTVAVAFAAIPMGVIGALVYVTVEGLSSWAHLVVLAGIVLAAIGVMIAVDPLGRH